MDAFALVSVGLLAVILVWVVYHARILLTGLKSKNEHQCPDVSGDEASFPKFSLIVPVKEEASVIGRCLKALSKIDYPPEQMEVLIVTTQSKDATSKICDAFSKKFSNFKVIDEVASQGKPSALNLALSYAAGDVVGVFDADSVPKPNVLRRIASCFADSSVLAVQGNAYSVNEDENMLTKVGAMEDKAWLQGLLYGREKLKLFVAFTGSCQFIRIEVLKALGGWEKDALAEDVALSLKLAERNQYVKFAPEVSCGQETPFNLKGLITQRTRWYKGYMQEALKSGSLLKGVSRRTIDAEFSLVGPFVMVLCFASYINWGLSVFFSSANDLLGVFPLLVVFLNSVTLVSLGLAMAFSAKPVKVKSLFWVPFVYVYWFLQMLIATRAFFQVLFRRGTVWEKTVKNGFVSSGLLSGFKPQLRVCFISSYPPNHARLSEYARNLVNELKARPAISKIYLLADKSGGSVEGSDSKVEVRRVWMPDDPLSILGIMVNILRIRPDVVHFNVHFQSFGRKRLANFTGLSLIFLSRLLGFKVLAEAHNLGEKVNLKKVQLKPTFVNRMGIFIATKMILSAPKVTVTVRSYAAYLKQRYGHRGVQYIPHGTFSIDCSYADPDEKVILIFGHMGPYKGLSVLFEAYKELRAQNCNIRLVVGGSSHPNYPNFLDQYVKANIENVEFLGYVPESELADVFLKADVVVIPYSTATGTSGVFHLACGYGRPIVASSLPEIRELVVEGASALLVPPENVKALKEALLKVLYDEQLAVKMSEQNLLFARKESWSIVAEAYEEAYLELLSH